ncbi:MAG TPA: hypothetical protein VEK38_02355, partial [Candidatus Bathyarchaeia archaeon]|nr:hypothetical protein [Candidatus Bathyarchaeia archaeon]
PRYEIQKEYRVTTKNKITPRHCQLLTEGVELDDGHVMVDEVVLEDAYTMRIILHSGKNRIIRRLCDALGLEMHKLDRIGYAGLTKKGIRVGEWRYLTKEEITHLKKEIS